MTKLEELRQMLGDPSEDLLSNDLLEHFLDEEGDNLNYAAAKASRVIMRNFSLKAQKALGSIRKDYSRQAEMWRKIAEEFETQEANLSKPLVGAISKAQKQNQEQDTDRTDPFFDRDSFFTPERGG